MEIHEMVALGIGVIVILALVIYERIMTDRANGKIRAAEERCSYWKQECITTKIELETIRNRCESSVSHQVYIRDQKIEELELKMEDMRAYYEEQLHKWEVKCKLLEDLANKNFQKAAKK